MDVISGEPLTWNNWAKNQPASLSEDQDCAVINKNWKLEAVRCTDKALTFCRLEGPVRFQLRGAPEQVWWPRRWPDTQYTMVSPTLMTGHADTAIIATTGPDGWAIIDVRENKTMATSPGASFPLGTRTQSTTAQIKATKPTY